MALMGFTKFTLSELDRLSKDKLEDAKSLLSTKRYAACNYICGYALELILKYRIAKQLNWAAVDINDHPFLKIHDLDKLVKYTGVFDKVLKMPQWNTCRNWSADSRYQDAESITEPEASKMLISTQELVSWLLAN
jgi:hypothetical protein